MRRYATWAGGLVLGLGLLLAGQSAQAVIKNLVPLQQYLSESEFILTAKVDSIDANGQNPKMVLVVSEDLKDKAPFRRLPVTLASPTNEGVKEDHVGKLLKRVAVNQPLVIFVQKKGGKKFTGWGYVNGTWFQMSGEGDPPVWRFLNCEPYLRRTFKGTTEEMQKVIVDGLAEKAKPPDVDEKAEPGFGPELKPEEKKDKPPEESRLAAGGPLFAVIPTGAIGGLIAILALFFPALFGGMALTMKRWIAAVTVLSLNSTLLCLWVWFSGSLGGTFWGSPLGLWTVMTAVTVLGIVWSWQRHLATLPVENGNGSPAPQPTPAPTAATPAAGGTPPAAPAATPPGPLPNRSELIVLGVMSGLGLVMVAVCLVAQWGLFDDSWSKPLLVMWIGFWAATLYAFSLALFGRRRYAPAAATNGRALTPPLPCEGVMLGVIGVASLLLGVVTAEGGEKGGVARTQELPATDDDSALEAEGARPLGVAWTWKAKEVGVIYSSPAVTADNVFAAASHGSAFPFGRVYCLDRASGKQVWAFDDDREMKQVFSSPCVVGDRLYVGEGFHQDHDCRMYCLKAATGEKLWAFETKSHTESSPTVSKGKVYFGAGDDGLFCLNAEDGKEVWHYEKLHVDASPVIAGGKVFGGSGVGDVYNATCMFCVDAATGKEVWKVPTELPVWGSPVVVGKQVIYGLGNGDFTKSSDKPAGAVMCLDAETGNRIWEYKVPDGVLDRPAADRRRVYFGSRDGYVYCVSREDGTLVWKQNLGSPVLAGVVLAPCTTGASLFALGSAGKVYCLDPETGKEDYAFDVMKEAKAQPELFSTLTVKVRPEGRGLRRQIVFGAGLNNFVSRAAAVYCFEDHWGQ